MEAFGNTSLDDLASQMLGRQGWTADSIPEAGRFVALRRIETTASEALMKMSRQRPDSTNGEGRYSNQ